VQDDALELVELGRGVARARVILQGKVRLSVPGLARLGRAGWRLFRLRRRDVNLSNEWLTGVGSKVATNDDHTHLG
jgi:hypothetical protein